MIHPPERRPEFSPVPSWYVHGAEADSENVEIGCREGRSGWFDVLEFDKASRRLVRAVRFVNKPDMPDVAFKERDENSSVPTDAIWKLQKEWASVFRVMVFRDYSEFPGNVVLPRTIEIENRIEGGGCTYHLKEFALNKELPAGCFNLAIPDGTTVVDFSLDPLGDSGTPLAYAEYLMDSNRSLLEWSTLLDQERGRIKEILDSRKR